MIIEISSDALIDLETGFDFDQRQSQGLGASSSWHHPS
jgi:hypothetical protein